jgi:hypothetical protein
LSRKYPLLHFGGYAFARILRSLPRSLRFGYAVQLARFARPVIGRTDAVSSWTSGRFDGVRDSALHVVLERLTAYGVAFDPTLEIEGESVLRAAVARGSGVLVIAPHAQLSLLVPRYLTEQGLPPLIIAKYPMFPLRGTDRFVETFQPSATYLLKVRGHLRAGGVVCAMIDDADPAGRRTVAVETEAGRLFVSPALLEVAVRTSAEVVFTSVHVTRAWRVVATFEAASPSSARSVAGLTSDYVRFVNGQVAKTR